MAGLPLFDQFLAKASRTSSTFVNDGLLLRPKLVDSKYIFVRRSHFYILSRKERNREMRFAHVVPIIAMIVFGLTGCGKIPTWGELTGEQKPAEPAPAPVVVAPPPVVQTVTPTGPSPQEVIAKFKATQPSLITDQMINQLTNLTEGLDEITEINADSSAITKNAFNSIEKLTNLRQLRLNSTKVDNEACQKIAQLPSLEILFLNGTAVGDVGVAALSDMKNLKHLELSNCSLSENGFSAIGNLPSLTWLEVRFTNLDNRMLSHVCNARTLKRLGMQGNPIDDYGLAALGKLGELEYLEISETRITGAGLVTAQKGLKSLIHLGMYRCPMDEAGALAVSHFKGLEYLNLGKIPQLDDMHLQKILSGMKNLKFLSLHECSNITGAGLQGLVGNKVIEEIILSGCPLVGDKVANGLKTFKSLKSVTLLSTSITPNAVRDLKLALPELKVN